MQYNSPSVHPVQFIRTQGKVTQGKKNLFRLAKHCREMKKTKPNDHIQIKNSNFTFLTISETKQT